MIKIVNDELVSLMGSETTELPIKPGNDMTVIMMAGLQGAGKTTTAAKLAGKLKAKGEASASWLPVMYTGRQLLHSFR